MDTRDQLIVRLEQAQTDGSTAEKESSARKVLNGKQSKPLKRLALTSARSIAQSVRREGRASTRSTPPPVWREAQSTPMPQRLRRASQDTPEEQIQRARVDAASEAVMSEGVNSIDRAVWDRYMNEVRLMRDLTRRESSENT